MIVLGTCPCWELVEGKLWGTKRARTHFGEVGYAKRTSEKFGGYHFVMESKSHQQRIEFMLRKRVQLMVNMLIKEETI